jgi:hypothetical protein
MPEDQLLTEMIANAVDKATQSLQDRISTLDAIIAHQEGDMADLRQMETSLSSTQEQDACRLALDIAYDRQRLTKLEKVEPQPMQRDRADILRALLAANGGKILAKDARQKMRLSKERFSNLLLVCDFIERKPYHFDRRQDVIILKSGLVRPNY